MYYQYIFTGCGKIDERLVLRSGGVDALFISAHPADAGACTTPGGGAIVGEVRPGSGHGEGVGVDDGGEGVLNLVVMQELNNRGIHALGIGVQAM